MSRQVGMARYIIRASTSQEKILKHLDLWDVKPRPSPKATESPKTAQFSIDYATSQLPASDKWLYVDPGYPETYHA